MFDGRVFHGGTDFDAAEEVAPHPVGAGDEELFAPAAVEVEHAGVFEQAADDGAHADVFGKAGYAGAQGAHAAHD